MKDLDNNDAFLIVNLLTRRTRGEQLTALEDEQLDIWLRNRPDNTILNELEDPEKLTKSLLRYHVLSDKSDQFDRLRERIKRKKQIIRMKIWSIAASIVLLAGSTLWIYSQYQDNEKTGHLTNRSSSNNSPIAEKHSILQLSNGKKIILESGNETVVNTRKGISDKSGKKLSSINDISWANLTVPKGATCRIILPDGTIVRLNAASSLRYPSQFTGVTREVELNGEGFFEVAHNAERPFIVKTAKQHIQVLGTKFNVRAYPNVMERTSLIIGKVAVQNQSTERITLLPGQQAYLQGDILKKKTGSVQDDIAWLDGQIIGNLLSLPQLGPDIERWYDIRFIYNGRLQYTERAFVNIDRNEKLTNVLRALEQMYNVQLELRGKEVFVY